MKKKNGFISVTMIYSFFLVFLMLLLFIVSDLVYNRIVLNKIKDNVYEDISNTNFARYLINNYESLGLVNHDNNLETGAMDNSYRYTGVNPNNYVLFNNELWRIIGVINGKVKLIKDSVITIDKYDSSNSNVYVNTSIYNYLKNVYLPSLNDYQNYLEVNTWYVGGIENTFLMKKVYEIYNYELGNFKNNGVTINEKIALPYISDYAYAGDINSYDKTITNTNNWMFMDNLWTITRVNTYYNQVYYIKSDGTLGFDTVDKLKRVRPVVILKNSVLYASGDGTYTNPYKIEV